MNWITPVVCAAGLAVLPVAAGAAPVKLTVEAAHITAPVNPLGFGNNLEAADARGIFGGKAGSAPVDPIAVKYGQGFWNPREKTVYPAVAALIEPLRIGSMRYPGGCLAHNFNWQLAVGPSDERREWQFGVNEFLELCRMMKWEPVITLSDYVLPADELPKHLAGFVEYLNAPAVPEHPWAMKRAAWGHPEPFGVKYFEIGNESRHGSHKLEPSRQFTPESYAKFARETAAEIRRVDPKAQLGIITIPGSGLDYDATWNRGAIAGAGAVADYLVIHFYGPGMAGVELSQALPAALAYPDQLADRMADFRRFTKEVGGKELPLAISEYNVGSTTNQPYPYRFTFLGGLMNADMMRVWQQPENRVLFANYWQILNGYWGAVNSDPETGEISGRNATLPFFQAWGKYRCDNQVAVRLENCPRISVPESYGIVAAVGETGTPERVLDTWPELPLNLKNFENLPGVVAKAVGPQDLEFDLKRRERDLYTNFAHFPRPEGLPAGQGFKVRVTGEARFTPSDPADRGDAVIRLGLVDDRGWEKTSSAIAFGTIQEAEAWRPIPDTFITLPDCPGVNMLIRVENPRKPVSGKIELRNLNVELSGGKTLPAYPALSTFASKSADGKRLCLIVFNKSPRDTVLAEVKLQDFPASTGEALELYQENVVSTEYFEGTLSALKPVAGVFEYAFPKHSMTAFSFMLP